MPTVTRRLRTLCTATLASIACASTGAGQTTPVDLTLAREYFAELRLLTHSDGGKLWGRSLDGPAMFADRATRTIVANMPDTGGLLAERNGVWVGMLSPDRNIANTAIDWAGRRWTMVVWPVSDSRYSRRRLLLHETFHRIQPALGLPSLDRANSHLATVNGRIWTRLEWRALTEALLRSGPARTEALRDALTFRARRRSLYPDGAEEERLLELNEGLAEYTGLALSGLPRAVHPDRVAVQLAQYEQQENFARSFAYASGPAYALLLDGTGKPWRARLNAASDLSVEAARAYALGRIDPRTADGRSARYTATRMIAEERAREAQRVAAEARLRSRFIDGPTLTLPVAGKLNYSFDPNAATPLSDVGTVFESSRATDEWGVLDVSSGGVLLRRTGGNVTSIVVPLAAGAAPPLNGEGWRVELAAGWTVRNGPRPGDWIAVPPP